MKDEEPVRIETQNAIAEQEWAYLTQWKERVFPEEGRGKEWSRVAWHTIAYSESDDPVGHIGFDGFRITVEDIECLVIGIGGVVVRPEYQGQGIPALLFHEVHNQAPGLIGSQLFTLFCPSRLVPYYERHGYERHVGRVQFLQRGDVVPSAFDFMHKGGIAVGSEVALNCAPW